MSDTEPSDRARRDPPARRGPIRSVLTPTPTHQPSESAPLATGPASAMGAAVDESMRAAWRIVDGATQTMQGAVERGVETAYMVIDEYMLRGRQAARRYSPRSNGDTSMNDDRYQQNGYPNTGGWGPMGPMSPMMMPWFQMMRMWTDAMTAFVPGAGNMGSDWMSQWAPGMYPPNATAQRGSAVAVHLTSKQPAEVTVEVSPGADGMTLRAEPLVHASSTDAPPLVGIGVECNGGKLRVRVAIPNDQPAGAYRGALVDSGGVHRGMLRVDIEAARRARTRAAGV